MSYHLPITTLKDIANAQAQVIAEALKAANIDIVGGETMFFEKIELTCDNAGEIQ